VPSRMIIPDMRGLSNKIGVRVRESIFGFFSRKVAKVRKARKAVIRKPILSLINSGNNRDYKGFGLDFRTKTLRPLRIFAFFARDLQKMLIKLISVRARLQHLSNRKMASCKGGGLSLHFCCVGFTIMVYL